MQVNTIICGATPEATKGLPDGSINCCISSPPYWALRDYGVDGQLGLEPTFEEYIDKLCTIYDEVKRVLRPDGTCWVNLGDTYAGSTQGGGNPEGRCDGGTKQLNRQQESQKHIKTPLCGLQAKSLCLIPQRFAIEMVKRGWILRNVIIWHKPNPMPSSAKDRFTVDFEYVYFFVKSKKYWFEPQYEPYLTESNADRPRMGQGQNTKYQQKRQEHKNLQDKGQQLHSMHLNRAAGNGEPKSNPLGRNKRTVWTIPTQPYPEAHFATFPEKLVEPMIKAGCPEFVCTKCGKGREKIYEKGELVPDEPQYKPRGRNKPEIGVKTAMTPAGSKQGHPNFHYETSFKGYTDCGCHAEWRSGVVLDIFGGVATTALVAYKLKRDYIIVELKPEYCEMGIERLKKEKEKYGLLENNNCIEPELELIEYS